jgi:hypothetical protein
MELLITLAKVLLLAAGLYLTYKTTERYEQD